MTFEYPGSTKVVTWEDKIPDYGSIDEYPGVGDVVRIPLSGDISTDIDRYENDEGTEAVVDAILKHNPNFDEGMDIENFLKIAYGKDNANMVVKVSEFKRMIHQ